uniref:IRG-type G domain-containing protein n=1 Tax=Acrobeloides nanus TaxID=290746 RepID=A0A914DQ50_9BILA
MGALLNKLTSIFQNPPEAPIVETKINRRALAHAREVLKIDDTKYFNIAVAGKQNAGKSTFINALCGRANFERGDDIAEACPLETTRKPKAFYASRFPHLRLYDLPGFGTLDIHSDNYLDKYIFNEGVCAMYCILLFYESGIPQEFARFVKEAKKYNVNLAIIHSKADQVLKNYHKNDNPVMFPTIDQEAANRVVKLLLEVFEKKKQQPEYKLFRNIPCFVISSHKLLDEFGKKQYNGGADIEEYLEYQEQDLLQFISKLKDIEKIENDIRKEVLTYMHISCIQQAKFISRKWMQTIQNNNNELPKKKNSH